ncbi:VOC family protein [Streptomyces sp. NPDC050560]|uniref:VOC family protein n=1 Tax=Streptomyces sp. NPDC050560 TaxID=3365630 RepID=UPI0037A8FB26
MATRINHIAIVSDQFALMGTFYAAVFGLQGPSDLKKSAAAANLTDGYVGLNINPRKPGRQAGLDHFGFEVDDLDATLARARELYPDLDAVKRPSNRPFAAYSAHDPAGNVFDLSQAGLSNRGGVYAEEHEQSGPSRFSHFMLRTMRHTEVASFYQDVLELKRVEPPRAAGDAVTLTDGTIEIVIVPWTIGHFLGTGIARPSMDHFGFVVDSLDDFKAELAKRIKANPSLAPRTYEVSPEANRRVRDMADCPAGSDYQLADPDGILLDVRAAA